MIEHIRRHKVLFEMKPAERGEGVRTEEILGGMEKINAVTALVESVIIWRAQHIAWNVAIDKAEPLLFRLIYKEGVRNPQAMDLLARIYFQQGKYEKAKNLWDKAAELQPGNPAQHRTANAMNAIAKSPAFAIMCYKFGVVLRSAMLIALICLAGRAGVLGVEAFRRWTDGPIAVQNLSGRFHYAYDSITKDMTYVPTESTVEIANYELVPVVDTDEFDGTRSLGFTRKKAANSREFGRVEVAVEQAGNTLKAFGMVPDIDTRYLIEQTLLETPGIQSVDTSGLYVGRSYRVSDGDSLWLIAKRVYGDSTAWILLAKANDIHDPSKLKIGQELLLPLSGEYTEIADEN
jgi:nucleoid-associated protein YgaU